MATHSSILAWRIPWTEKPGRLQSMTHDKGHEEGGWAYTKAGSSLGSPPGYS